MSSRNLVVHAENFDDYEDSCTVSELCCDTADFHSVRFSEGTEFCTIRGLLCLQTDSKSYFLS